MTFEKLKNVVSDCLDSKIIYNKIKIYESHTTWKEFIKILNIKYIYTFVPKGSCGTGYSEPSKYEFTYTRNGGSYIYKSFIWIDTWYRPKEYYKECFIEGIKRSELNNYFILNIDDAYDIWLESTKAHEL